MSEEVKNILLIVLLSIVLAFLIVAFILCIKMVMYRDCTNKGKQIVCEEVWLK